MKKVLLPILLTLLPLLASAETVEIDGIWYNLISKAKEAEVIGNPESWRGSYYGNIVIPTSVTYNEIEYSVTSIGEYAFYYCESLESISIPNSVTSIGEGAFEECRYMTSVHISSIESWCKISFKDNPLWYAHHLYLNGEEVKNLFIPNGVTKINGSSFAGCTGLTSVTIPNSVKSIEGSAFSHCKSLTSVSIPNSVTSIEGSAFYYCTGLTSVTIPNSVNSIGNYTFFRCSSLTSVTIPNSVTSIGYQTFYECTALTSIAIPNNVTSIGSLAFSDCKSLTSVSIPNSVTSIGERALQGCSGLTSVTIGSGVNSIGNQAFASCDELRDVYCLVETVTNDNSWNHEGLYTNPTAFQDSYPKFMTLHVPTASVEAYRSTAPWSTFKAIVPLEDGETPVIQKCATPEISYENGMVNFTCETEGVEFISSVTLADEHSYYDDKIQLSQKYKISVYATKTGYYNSDTTTREIEIKGDNKPIVVGDVDGDGKVNVADHVKLSDIIMNQ